MVKDALKCLLDADFSVTKHFKLKEFFNSATAAREGIENCPNTYKRLTVVLQNIRVIAEMLEIIRAANLNIPVIITSCYRCVTLNNKVNGVCTSKHLDGAAVDITCRDLDTLADTIGWCQFKNIKWYVNKDKNYIHIELINCNKVSPTILPQSKRLQK